jgi:3-oxoacyl-[acyl-carrier protein] reductase
MARLTGKTAVVTGASLGIGAAIAERLADDGAAVVVNYGKSKDAAGKLVEKIQSKGGKATAVQADLSKPADAKKLFAEAKKAYGTVDILVNNAGIYEFKPIGEIDEAHFDKQFNLNVKGLLFATQEAARQFGEEGGAIVNLSSVVSLTPIAGSSVYAATKGAVDVLTKTSAAELGPRKIRVNAVNPGPVVTEGFHALEGSQHIADATLPRTPLGRLGQPGDIADAVAFLVSDDARWITGEVIPVAGGLRL